MLRTERVAVQFQRFLQRSGAFAPFAGVAERLSQVGQRGSSVRFIARSQAPPDLQCFTEEPLRPSVIGMRRCGERLFVQGQSRSVLLALGRRDECEE